MMGIDNVLQIQTKENEDLLTLCSLGHHLGYVWGMSGASSGACLGQQLGQIAINGQQWTKMRIDPDHSSTRVPSETPDV